jgi:predicted amidophosphoribosyltransferase
MAQALKLAKYGRDRQLMRELADVFALRLGPALDEAKPDCIVPTPSPWTRRLWRGFSPAALMAEALSHRTGVPTVHALRLSPGRMLAGLGATERRRALTGRVRSKRAAPGVVLLVDDIATTGATADACCRELLGDASSEVWLATLCVKGPPPR